MKLNAFLAVCALALAAAAPAAAHEEQYGATLTGAAEVPTNASPGTGSALVTVDFDMFTMRVQASFAGLLSNTTASHIHCCLPTATGNAGVATMLPTFVDFPLGVTSGTYDHTFDMALAASYNPAFVTAQGSVSNAFGALVAGMQTGNAYLNIHTTQFPGGEIRGLLNVVAVPEPETYGLMLAGLGALGWAVRRRPADRG
jgi:hypothetical protein